MALRNWHDGPDCVVIDARPDPSAAPQAVQFPPLPGEHEWMRVRRQRAYDQATRAVERLMQTELHANEKQLVEVVAWLTTHQDMALGERIPAAFMQSNMGATVDREVYHPLLRAKLGDRWPLSVVVPVTAAECDSPHAVLELVGKQLWTTLQVCIQARAERRTQRQGKVPPPPRGVYALETMCEMAKEWSRESDFGGRPLCVVLLEDFSKFDRRMLRALFQTLAEAQHRRMGNALAFCVVLWASSDVVFDADLADHLYLARFPFIPPSMMLQNVLLAVLVEPTLPFALPEQTYTWVRTHFELHSQSLTWMRNVLRALVTLHFFHRPDLWLLHVRDTADVSDADLLPALRALQPRVAPDVEGQRAAALAALAAVELQRWVRCRGFTATWRLLRCAAGDAAKPILVAYGDYLRIHEGDPHGQAYGLRIKALLETRFQITDPERALQEAERACDAVDAEIDVMIQERRVSDDAGDRQLIAFLRNAKARLADARAAVPEPAPPVAVAPVAAEPVASARPRDRLLGTTTAVAAFQRAGSSGGSSRGSVRASVLSSAPHVQAAERAVAALVACMRVLVDGTLVTDAATAGSPFAQLFEFRMPGEGGVPALVRALVGDFKNTLVRELLEPSLGCQCCAGIAIAAPPSRIASAAGGGGSSANKRRKGAALADLAAPSRWEHIYGGPLEQLATREDISIAFLYYNRVEHGNNSKLNVADWFAFFSDVLAGQSAINARFQRVMQELQLMGLIASSGGNAQHTQTFVRKTLDE